jgi:hypothetical protein
MTEQYCRNLKSTVGVAIITFVLPTLCCKLGGAAASGCKLLDDTAWVALGLLRSVILLPDWHAVWAYLWNGSRLFQHLQNMSSIWSLICVVAG